MLYIHIEVHMQEWEYFPPARRGFRDGITLIPVLLVYETELILVVSF